MAKYNAYMQFWIGDYLADTTNLTTQRHGVYLLLIFHYWRHGCLPDDKDELYEITKCRSEKCSQDVDYIVKKYFPNGKNKRLDEELGKAKESYQRRVNAQEKSVKSRKKNSNANCNAVAMQLQSYDSDSDYSSYSKKELSELFESKFWPMWGKGARKADARKWFVEKGRKRDKQFFDMLEKKIQELQAWRVKADSAGMFVAQLPAFAVWLNQERWEDELVEPNAKNGVQTPNLPDPLADKLACIAEAFDSGRHLFVGEKRVELANGLLVDIDSGRTVNAYQFLKSGSEVRIV